MRTQTLIATDRQHTSAHDVFTLVPMIRRRQKRHCPHRSYHVSTVPRTPYARSRARPSMSHCHAHTHAHTRTVRMCTGVCVRVLVRVCVCENCKATVRLYAYFSTRS